MRAAGLFFILITSVLFAGCFEVTEDIWINPDGSGRLRIDMGISEALISAGDKDGESRGNQPFGDLTRDFEKTKMEIEKNPNIKKFDFKQYSEAGMKHFAFDVEVKDISTLNELQKAIYSEKQDSAEAAGSPGGMPMGKSELRIEKTGSGHLLFVRNFGEPDSSKDTSEAGAMADSMGKGLEELGMTMARSMFGNSYYTVRLHASNIISSNGKIDEEKKMVEWKLSIAEMMGRSAQRELRAEIGSPRNLFMWVIVGVIGIGILGGVVAVVRKKKPPLPS